MSKRILWLGGATAFLAACGGEGTAEVAFPAPSPNAAPVITAPDGTIRVEENITDIVTTIMASDSDGDMVTFTIVDGDVDAFTLNANGELSFVVPPDFETPNDTNGDNVYVITVQASDGQGGSSEQTYRVEVTDQTYPERRLYRSRQFGDIQSRRNLEYAPGLFADVFFAADSFGPPSERPLILFAGGGGFIVEDRQSVEPMAQDFAGRGWIAVTIDYRTLGRFPNDEAEIQVAATRAVHDMFAAVRGARAETGFLADFVFDRSKIAVSGESAGGVMAVTVAALDPQDTINPPAIAAYLADNGGAYGDVGNFDTEDSRVQGAMPLSGALFDLEIVDQASALTLGAHEENDPVVPCGTGPEGATGVGAIVSGTCDFFLPFARNDAGPNAFIIRDDAGHVDFTDDERSEIYTRFSELFVERFFTDEN